MPDKQLQDWTADEQFWEEAWGDMQQKLDAEMPQQKKQKRRYWYLSAATLTVLLVFLTLYVLVDDRSVEGDRVASFRKPSIIEKRIDELEHCPPTTANTDTFASSFTKSKIEAAKAIVDRSTEQLDDISQDHTTSIPVAAPVEEGASKRSSVSISQLVSSVEDDGMKHKAVASLPMYINQLAVAEHEANIALQKIKRNSDKAVAFSLSAGFNRAILGGNGLYLDARLIRSISPKSSLGISIGIEHQQERIRSVNNENSAEDVTTIGTGHTVDFLAIDANRNYLKAGYIRLGMEYSKSISNRWQLNTSLGVNYLLSLKAPRSSIDSSLIYLFTNDQNATVNILSEHTYNATVSNSLGNRGTLRELLDIGRIRYDLQLGFNYRLNTRLSANLALRYYFNSVFKKRYTTPSLRTNLGLSYQF